MRHEVRQERGNGIDTLLRYANRSVHSPLAKDAENRPLALAKVVVDIEPRTLKVEEFRRRNLVHPAGNGQLKSSALAHTRVYTELARQQFDSFGTNILPTHARLGEHEETGMSD